ncbi:nitrogen-specific signal transduction histidine kinase [Sedimentibacter acidaminivorans]|uniref:histidine kinase n=1 Tax=Sedimentibacter acidaminivorans TaxID=913099 RepID=A0ABS4GGJ8_9FIRM|nr:ATP-binding protein [Sedimentibacter acidaminivorans]MBP1926816.1 nitrogen-specific signal transduction histidine kinase [Sedimentibacter acidaminivorans]
MVTKGEKFVNVKSISNSDEKGEIDCTMISKQIINAEKQREKMAALGQLAGGIAHDFNNQLMSIIGNATLIQKTDDINKIKEYADRIIHISQSTANLTKKILLFSKNESSVNEPIDLKGVLDNTYTMVSSIFDKSINVKYNYNASNKMIVGNETQIDNLLINLLINSRDAVGTGGIITIGTEDVEVINEKVLSHGEIIKKGEYIKIVVQDNGAGMKEETFDKMFEPYFSTKNKSKGTGLGLSVVFGTVKSHSGFINVISKLYNGTIIEIYLPVHKPKNDLIKIHANQTQIKGNLIMLVDDDINVLDIEAELLEDLGYEVKKFDNSLKAIEFYEKEYEKINFVVLDLLMPIMGGKELHEKLKKINKEVIPIFITGYSGQAECEEIINSGYTIVEKPFTFDELSTKIAKIYK